MTSRKQKKGSRNSSPKEEESLNLPTETITISENITASQPGMIVSPSGWVCPRCGFIWSPATAGCLNCNHNYYIPSSYPVPTIYLYPYDPGDWQVTWQGDGQ